MKIIIFSILTIITLCFPISQSFSENSCAINTREESSCSITSSPQDSPPSSNKNLPNSSADDSKIASNESTSSFMRHQIMAIPPNAPLISIEMFYSFDCPHCHEALSWIPELKRHFPNVTIQLYEIKKIKANQTLFEKTAAQHNVSVTGVPTFFIGDKVFVGFYKNQTCCLLLDEIKSLTFKSNSKNYHQEIKVPILGTMRVDQISLLNFSIVIGLLDGLNPCAMWVLMFLLGLLIHTRSKQRILLIGSIFVIASGVVYFAFMSAWFSLFSVIGYSQIIRWILAIAAILMGLINIKEIFFFKKGFSLMIPESTKPKIAQKIRKIMQEQNLYSAIVGTILLAIFVNLIELGCTIGLPAIFTKILADRSVSVSWKYLYMVIYNIAYIVPLAIIVGIFTLTLGHYKMTEHHGKILKLISGLLMLLLGIVMLIKPEMLTLS
ncbi:MAG: hypothetical protein HQK53_14135 [Oligoflexia bacterium]|nr:hypothetical protein [Oligoflexia bacterium]